jgi:hypothetical protein
MPVRYRTLLGVGIAAAISAGAWLSISPADATLPPGYEPVPGIVPLNPLHVDAVGSEFTQQCTGLTRPIQPGEVAWHFVLPQSVLEERAGGPAPLNVFDVLRVRFQNAGPVVTEAFGPPSAAHAFVFTPTDDVLLGGNASIGRAINRLGGNDPQFNLSHTCWSPTQPTTTTTAGTTTTTDPAAVLGESQTNGPDVAASTIPRTGGGNPRLVVVAIVAVVCGTLLVLSHSRTWTGCDE